MGQRLKREEEEGDRYERGGVLHVNNKRKNLAVFFRFLFWLSRDWGEVMENNHERDFY